MTNDLQAIKARVEAATPGPMKVVRSDLFPALYQYLVIRADQELNEHGQVAGGPFQIWDNEADAIFDAHARTDILTLFTALDERDVVIRELAEAAELNLMDAGPAPPLWFQQKLKIVLEHPLVVAARRTT